ncbi:hypothetical protein Q675_05205 [Labrenzia sp. C1B70]|nr:hypothetical protein Q675_05205 [Labrenzia sp. C1B70]
MSTGIPLHGVVFVEFDNKTFDRKQPWSWHACPPNL